MLKQTLSFFFGHNIYRLPPQSFFSYRAYHLLVTAILFISLATPYIGYQYTFFYGHTTYWLPSFFFSISRATLLIGYLHTLSFFGHIIYWLTPLTLCFRHTHSLWIQIKHNGSYNTFTTPQQNSFNTNNTFYLSNLFPFNSTQSTIFFFYHLKYFSKQLFFSEKNCYNLFLRSQTKTLEHPN